MESMKPQFQTYLFICDIQVSKVKWKYIYNHVMCLAVYKGLYTFIIFNYVPINAIMSRYTKILQVQQRFNKMINKTVKLKIKF